MMPLNYSSREQVSGRRRRFHRLSVAVGQRSAVLLVSTVIAVLIVGLCLMLAVFNPAGQVGSSQVLADWAGGGLHDAPEVYR